MRRPLTLAISVASLFSFFGCQAILGTFTTEGGGTPDAAGNDAPTDTSTLDGSTDGDASGPPKLLTCAVDGNPHKITTNAGFVDDRISVHVLQSGNRRVGVVVAKNPPPPPRQVQFFDVNEQMTSFNVVPAMFDTKTEGVGLVPYDGGFAAIGWKGADNRLYGSFLPDSATTASPFVEIITSPALSGNASNWVSAMAPIDAANGIFFVAFALQLNGSTDFDLYAGAVDMTNTLVLPPLGIVHTFKAGRPNIDSGGVLLDRGGKKAALILQPDKGLGDAQVLTIDFSAGAKEVGIRDLPGPNGTHVISSFATPSTPKPGTNGFGVLQGDLSAQNVPFGMRSGLIDDPKVNTFVVDDLPPLVPFASLDDLAVDKANMEWSFFPVVGPQLLLAGRYTGTGSGVNMVWLDGAGSLRARQSGATTLFSTEVVRTASASFRQPPTALIAPVVVTWLNTANDMMMADLTCKL